jgi:asparagine synthase (glutamine-hydrolysing)
MCYANPPGQLVFSSTADSVASHPAVGRRLSHQAIFNYLYCHMVPSPGTIYEGIQKLQPGECLIFRRYAGAAVLLASALQRPRPCIAPGTRKRFRDLLREAVKRAVGRDTDVGAFLSGGTDSSTVAGLLAEMGPSPARTYSIGFSADGFDEMEYARITSRHFSTEAHEYYVTPQDVVDAIPVIAAAYDEPFGNASAVPTYLCARMAHADGVRVMLAGDGGDEIFGGNVRYAKQKVFELYGAVPKVLRERVFNHLVTLVDPSSRLSPLRKLRSYIEQASIPLPERLEAWNYAYREPLKDILEPGFLTEIDPDQPLSLLRDDMDGRIRPRRSTA